MVSLTFVKCPACQMELEVAAVRHDFVQHTGAIVFHVQLTPLATDHLAIHVGEEYETWECVGMRSKVVAFTEKLLDDWEAEVNTVAQDRCCNSSDWQAVYDEIAERREEWEALRG